MCIPPGKILGTPLHVTAKCCRCYNIDRYILKAHSIALFLYDSRMPIIPYLHTWTPTFVNISVISDVRNPVFNHIPVLIGENIAVLKTFINADILAYSFIRLISFRKYLCLCPSPCPCPWHSCPCLCPCPCSRPCSCSCCMNMKVDGHGHGNVYCPLIPFVPLSKTGLIC